ncbi:hypothetical protein H5410_041754 [Solanum commersonii]|uniref:Uncharacterized protein n=1 Tax=Solanum commersonii TaxID=4109 RepID=A0A9J5XVM8_SOLCO|nr:hypothetical protein H5410_041754 [Solanum commersonii]
MYPRAWARFTSAVPSLTTAMNSTPLKTSSTPSLDSNPTNKAELHRIDVTTSSHGLDQLDPSRY